MSYDIFGNCQFAIRISFMFDALAELVFRFCIKITQLY